MRSGEIPQGREKAGWPFKWKVVVNRPLDATIFDRHDSVNGGNPNKAVRKLDEHMLAKTVMDTVAAKDPGNARIPQAIEE